MSENNSIIKTCLSCKENLPFSFFSKDKKKIDKLTIYCKGCEKDRSLAYRRTKEGLINTIYSCQKRSSKRRRHVMPEYSLSELREWVFNQSSYNKLYTDWVKSGRSKWCKPSVDRLDDYKPYTIDNLQLMTWRENLLKAAFDRKSGINNKASQAVFQLTREGIIVNEFYSTAQASRETGVIYKGIWLCCRGKRKTAGNFVWVLA